MRPNAQPYCVLKKILVKKSLKKCIHALFQNHDLLNLVPQVVQIQALMCLH